MNLGKILITNTFYCFYYENKKKIALRNQSDLIFRKVYFKISISPYKPQLGHMYRLSYDLRMHHQFLILKRRIYAREPILLDMQL